MFRDPGGRTPPPRRHGRCCDQVEELSHVGLALVRLDNGSLNIDVTGDEVGDARKILLEELGRKRCLLELLEQLAVRDNGMLDYLSAPVGELIVR